MLRGRVPSATMLGMLGTGFGPPPRVTTFFGSASATCRPAKKPSLFQFTLAAFWLRAELKRPAPNRPVVFTAT